MSSDDLIRQWKEAKEQNQLPRFGPELLSQFPSAEALDQKAHTLHESVSACIDCLSCANCCKTTVTVFTPEDIGRASRHLGMSRREFIKKHLIEDQGEYTTISTPCPFLLPDNKCRIYEVRPHACHSFPHTGRPHFLKRLKAHQENVKICPITYHVLVNLNR